MHTAETQGSLFLASMAEGFLGEDKLKVGAVDVRAPVSVLAQGYGLYQTIRGQRGAGAHVLALGNGIMGSWLATVARNAGRTLAEKRAGVASQGQASQAGQQRTVVMQGQTPLLTGEDLLPDPLVQGPVREVLLTPGQTLTEGLEDRPRRRRRRRRGRGRFVRAAHEDDGHFDDDA